MEQLLSILKEIDNTIDFEQETRLIDDQILDSFGIITLVSEIEEIFDVSIDTESMIPDNFNSVDAMWKMIVAKQEGR